MRNWTDRIFPKRQNGRLLTHLVYGVLRMQGHLDWILAQLYRGNFAGMEENVRSILRTGLYQLKFSERLPDFAAVNEAIKIARETTPAAAALTNAILRSYLRNPDKISFPLLIKTRSPRFIPHFTLTPYGWSTYG